MLSLAAAGWAEAFEPLEEDSIPEDPVLRLHDPVSFAGEVKESRGNLLELGCCEGFEPLFLTMFLLL